MSTTQNSDNQSFGEYRRKMHPDEDSARPVVPSPHKSIAIAFGIFMIFVYVGVGVLMLINFFRWGDSWTWMRWVLGIVLIIYGIFRGYRQFTGADYYSK